MTQKALAIKKVFLGAGGEQGGSMTAEVKNDVRSKDHVNPVEQLQILQEAAGEKRRKELLALGSVAQKLQEEMGVLPDSFKTKSGAKSGVVPLSSVDVRQRSVQGAQGTFVADAKDLPALKTSSTDEKMAQESKPKSDAKGIEEAEDVPPPAVLEVAKQSKADKTRREEMQFLQAMQAMMIAVESTTLLASRAHNDQSAKQMEISQAFVKMFGKIQQDVANKIKKIEAEQARQKALGIFGKIIQVIVAVVVSVLACAAGQVQIAALTIALTIASVSGGLGKATEALASGLEKLGLDPATAKIVATVIVTVIVIAVSMAAAPSGAASGASRAASIGGKLAKLNPFAKLSTGAQLGIMNGIQTVAQTNITQTIMDAVEQYQGHKLSPEEKKHLMIALTVVLAVATLVTSIGCGSALAASLANGAKTASGITGSVSKIASKLLQKMPGAIQASMQSLDGASVAIAAHYMQILGTWLMAATKTAEGGVDISKGLLLKDLSFAQASQQLVEGGAGIARNQMSETQKSYAGFMSGRSQMSQQASHLTDGVAGVASVLANQRV